MLKKDPIKDIYFKIKSFFKRLKNLYRWFPIIWKDQDWDDHYIFEILKFKLKNQAEYIGYHDRHMSAKRDAEIMMLCVRLIDKVQNEYYETEYQDYHDSEIKFTDSESYPGMYELDIIEKSEHFDDYFKKYPLIYKQVMNNKTLFHKTTKNGIAINIAHINHDRARKLLFKILEQHIEGWWD
jgi:hypothetical protein